MNDSLATHADQFEGLEWRHVLAMLSVFRECDYTRTEHIRKQYSQHASCFRQTLAFMVCLRAVAERGGHLHPASMLRAKDEAAAGSWLSQRLFSTRNRYRTQIFRYLRQFRIVDGELTYRPSSATRHRQSHVRNLLMEMRVVRYDKERGCYHIAPAHLDLYVDAQDGAAKRTPAAVAADQRDRHTIGAAAEDAVLSYERKRVGNTYRDRVEHIALLNAAAGYDVRSVTLDESGIAKPRYIEVKAVSGASLQFHWTRNEVRMAELLAQWYYLYLLPVERGGRFALDQLQVVQDPHTVLLHSSTGWAVEPDVLRCSRRVQRPLDSGVSTDDH